MKKRLSMFLALLLLLGRAIILHREVQNDVNALGVRVARRLPAEALHLPADVIALAGVAVVLHRVVVNGRDEIAIHIQILAHQKVYGKCTLVGCQLRPQLTDHIIILLRKGPVRDDELVLDVRLGQVTARFRG